MIIACVNIKGGVGKTTSAIALASAAARAGFSATVLDADPQASASLWSDGAADIDDPLPFAVCPANISTLKRLKSSVDAVDIIDCPPSGNVIDEAVAVAEFIVVPTSPKPADMAKTFETVETLERAGKSFAVLLTSVRTGTLAAKGSLAELDEHGVPRFEASIPLREDVGNFFGNSFGEELYGYDEVFNEILGEINNGGE